MRQQQTNGNSNYLNGNSALNRFNFDDGDSSRDTSDAERSRSRGAGAQAGYGGFRTQPPVQGVSRLDRGYARRSRDFANSQSRSRSRISARYGPQSGQVDGQSFPSNPSPYGSPHAHLCGHDCIGGQVQMSLSCVMAGERVYTVHVSRFHQRSHVYTQGDTQRSPQALRQSTAAGSRVAYIMCRHPPLHRITMELHGQ